MTIIKCTNLTKFYGREKVAALNGLTLDIPVNCVFGFLGPNGAGKTTTIKILTGLMKPSSGEARVAGEEVSLNSLKLRSKIGYLGQEPRMYSWMKGRELLLFVGEIFGFDKAARRKQADRLLEMSGLSAVSDKKISSFSGGMLQRLGIAQALVSNPQVLFLDEPTSSLDPIGRKEVLEFIHQLKNETTVFMSTHILSDVERICDIVAIVDQGKLVTEDKLENLKKRFSPLQIEIEFEHEQKCIDLENILKTTTIKDFRRQESTLFILPADIETDKRMLLGIINDQNLPLIRFELSHLSLEDVFVRLVGENNKWI